MILSMTGFGKAVVMTQNKKITAEIKSLNSKQLDLSVRIPYAFRELELEIRNCVAKRLERGKVDLSILVENNDNQETSVFNIPLLKTYKKQLDILTNELDLPEPADWYATLLRLPDALKNDYPEEISDEEKQAIFNAVENAINGLIEFRTQEGAKLESIFREKIANIHAHLLEVEPYEKERVPKIKARIEESLSKLEGIDYDKSRFEQEMIFYIEKLDINEEKHRLTNHLEYFIETLENGHGQGKKLGFISQEMGREINTLGSKSNHAEMQRIVVKMKDELEQIKEQVLNVL